ncbi:hypothetical protein R6V09_18640 [Streptomyces sp. W16]|uniref:hypothetical protein n=1 Tax=Streptomyces sp. W16 TaxID=3076631 RepID=UPI00295B5B1C|nr:hypothetical protein [Streptomyces sp. W16]MDV9172119.1 hypothetical protein [Streptomyces sp. W16]
MSALRKYADELCERAVREAEAEQRDRPDLLSTAEKQELARLRKELDQPRTRPTR